jgi:hypothetical protein
MSDATAPQPTRLTALLREPLLHFVVIACAIFVTFAIVDDRPPDAGPGTQIVISEDDAARLASQFEATWMRPPSAEELDAMIDQAIREEVYVREAELLGLETGDTIIRQRLQQKMEFLTEASAGASTPDEAVLRSYYAQNAADFLTSPRLAFDQIMLPPGTDAATAAGYVRDLNAGADPDQFGQPSLLPARLSANLPGAIDGTFGIGFFETVQALPTGRWAGPVASGYGDHLVRVTETVPAVAPPFEAVRDAVEQHWRVAEAERLRDAAYDLMRARYQVTRPDPGVVLAQ